MGTIDTIFNELALYNNIIMSMSLDLGHMISGRSHYYTCTVCHTSMLLCDSDESQLIS